MNQKALLLLAFGGPGNASEVRPFLSKVLEGRSVPQQRIEIVVQQYEAIGGKSPLNEITFQQAQALQSFLETQGNPLRVYVGMRNWTPFVEETLHQIVQDGTKTVRAIILSPFVCEASWTRYQKNLEQAIEKIRQELKIIVAQPWYHHPLFIEAMMERISEIKEPLRDSTWLFTAHSIPVSMDKESEELTEQRLSYSSQIYRVSKEIAEKCRVREWSVVYQSRSGNPQEPWLEPDISDKISELAKRRIQSVFVVPLGFVCDHVEVLYDLDIKARKIAEEAGIKFLRAKTVGPHPKFIQMLADLTGKI